MPFGVAVRDGIWTLTLDTPGSPINVFNRETALQLVDVLADVTPSTARAVVFESAKPNSFINGVGLLLAHASRSHDDIARASEAPWAAYCAVREAQVPTIAVVQGNCFGCGVEFALSCDFRIAADTCETLFYMTELNDYLFAPLFGGTWNIPEAVGVADAMDLLLWGDRWDAAKACAHGLIDAVVPYEDLAAEKHRFVAAVVEGRQPSRRRGRVRWGRDEDVAEEIARRRIADLPPVYNGVYSDALRLLRDGALQKSSYADHQRAELRVSADSALSSHGKAAYGFFYIRQMAAERAAGRLAGDVAPIALRSVIDVAGRERDFAETLCARRLPAAGPPEFRLVEATGRGGEVGDREQGRGKREQGRGKGEEGVGGGDRRSVHVGVALTLERSGDVMLYAPSYPQGGRLIELARRGPGEIALGGDDAAHLARTLQRLGFEVAPTTPAAALVSNQLLVAFLRPLAAYAQRFGDGRAVNAALRAAGFVRRPQDILRGLDRDTLVGWLSAAELTRQQAAAGLLALEDERYTDGEMGPVIIDAMCLSLLETAIGVRARREVRDVTIVDLIARELLDFPRHEGSLCAWLKRARVARALQDDPRTAGLVPELVLASARAFVAEGREFYR